MDEPPRGITRRQFVGRTVGVAAAAAAAGVGVGAVLAGIPKVTRPQRFGYLGVKVLPKSKSPQGLPLIPVRVREDGVLEGEPRHLEWYRYCGRTEAPGLMESYQGDNAFRYNLPHDRVQDAQRLGTWWREMGGQPARASDFKELGDGALMSWRSEGQRESNLLGALVVRVDPQSYEEPVRSEYVSDGFLAAVALCGHLCCAPVYRLGDSLYHEGHWDHFVCDCHGSWYDPAKVTGYMFPPTG